MSLVQRHRGLVSPGLGSAQFLWDERRKSLADDGDDQKDCQAKSVCAGCLLQCSKGQRCERSSRYHDHCGSPLDSSESMSSIIVRPGNAGRHTLETTRGT